MSLADNIDKYDYDHVGALNAGPIRHFLWFCAGADRQILKHCPQSERIKEEGIGGVVFATALLAFFSSAYAFYIIFVPRLGYAAEKAQTVIDQPTMIKAVIAGLVWACIIFNLDRLVVSSGGNDNNDGAKKFLKAVPRLLMAMIIGFTLSKPLEIKVMESEIQAELQKVQQQHYEEIIGIENQKYKENLNNIQQRKTEAIATHESNLKKIEQRKTEAIAARESNLKKIEQQKTEATAIEQDTVSKIEKRKAEAIKAREDKLLVFAALQQKKGEQEKTVYSEAAGDGKTGKAGRGPAWQDAKDNLERTIQETKAMEEALKSSEPQYMGLIADFNKQLENAQMRLAPSIAEFNKSIANEQATHTAAVEDFNKQSLTEQATHTAAIEDFNKQILTEQQRHKDADKQKQDESHQKDGLMERIEQGHKLYPVGSWALTILLLVIEVAPVLYKLMLANGTYHYLTENQKACAVARFAIQKKNVVVSGAEGGEVILEDVFHQADIILANRTAELTSEGRLSAHALNTFEAKIMKDIDTNPEKYIERPEQNKA